MFKVDKDGMYIPLKQVQPVQPVKNELEKKKSNLRLFGRIAAFIVFELVFSALFMPLMVFYGPFDNVKQKVVGTATNTLSHDYLARFFLSDEAVLRILGKNNVVAPDPVDQGQNDEIKVININKPHTDRIEMYNIDGGDLNGKLMIIYDPLRVKVGYSSRMPSAGETTSTIAKKNNAIAAINAGGFTDVSWAGTGGAPMGFVIHDGKIVYNQSKDTSEKLDTVAFTDKGMLIVGKHSIDQLQKYGVKEGVSFGPPLIVNGKPTIKYGDGGWGIAPRTAIGQREDGAVIFLVIDGRRLGSLGATLRDLQNILLQYKAVNAVNLDGGSSTTMYYNGKVRNNPSDKLGERAVPDVFMVCDLKEGNK